MIRMNGMEESSQKDIKERLKNKDIFILYLYTPLCGTCQVAGKMINIVAKIFPNLYWGKSDLNYLPDFAKEWEIESVPCLIIFKNHEIHQKIYAFHSVPFLYNSIKQTLDQ